VGWHYLKRAIKVLALHTKFDENSPAQLGAALARDYIHAQWLRIYIGAKMDVSSDEMENWCPMPRLRFRVPPWWLAHDLTIENDTVLFDIYRSFAAELNKIARSSDDLALNKTIEAALDHVSHALSSAPSHSEGPVSKPASSNTSVHLPQTQHQQTEK
jgi:hypothetical protein